MDENKLKFNQERIAKMFPNRTSLNKTEMLKVINISQSKCSRLNKQNDKFNIPCANDTCEYSRKNKKYTTYKYNVYDLIIFLTDKNAYWRMIKDRDRSC